MSNDKTREAHPWFMYDHMQSQPDVFRDTVSANRESLRELATKISRCRRTALVGIGTSFHAAQIGERLFHYFRPDVDCVARHSFDLAIDTESTSLRLDEKDCLLAISHRGTKRYTVEALMLARDAGCHVGLVTGRDVDPPCDVDHHFSTCDQEKSSAHTMSHTATVAVLAELARQCEPQSRSLHQRDLSSEVLDSEIPATLRSALDAEECVAAWAARYHSARYVWIVGAGPTSITARETALKIRETSYMLATGLSVEELLHGPFQGADSNDVFLLLCPAGVADDRMQSLAAMVEDIGASSVVVTDDEALRDAPSSTTCKLKRVPLPFCSLTFLMPAQLFTYHLALQRGTNPDGFRLEDERFATALKRVNM